MPKKPANILILVSDQYRYDTLRCAGHPVVETPNLDAMVAEGVHFTNAISNHPVCLPCRYSFITGLYTYQLGTLTNSHYWYDQLPVPTLGARLKEVGYNTAAIGKMHWKSLFAPDDAVPDKRGFDFRAATGGSWEGPLDVRYSAPLTPEQRKFQSGLSNRFGIGGESREGYVGDVSPVPSEKMPDYWLAEQAVKYLQEYEDDAPFCLIVSLSKPHPANVVPSDYANRYDPDSVPLPPSVPDGFYEDDSHMRRQIVNREWGQMDEREIRLSTARYLANCNYIDRCMGMVLDTLEATGHKDNTIVAFFSDHGDMLGERAGAHTKYCMYDSAMRVPLLMRWPGVNKPGLVSDAMVGLIDLMPTWLDAAQLDIPNMMQGENLRLLLEGQDSESIDWREGAFSEIYTSPENPEEPRGQWTLRESRHKFIQRSGSARSALYDLVEDPNEFNNLIDDPNLADVRERMRTTLLTDVIAASEQYPVVSIAHRQSAKSNK